MEARADALILAVERYREAARVPADAVDTAAIVAGSSAEGDRAVVAAAARAILRKVPRHVPPARPRRAHQGCGAMPPLLTARTEGLLDTAEEAWVAEQARRCPGCAQLLALADRALRAFEVALAEPEQPEVAQRWLPPGVAVAPQPADAAANAPANAWLPRGG